MTDQFNPGWKDLAGRQAKSHSWSFVLRAALMVIDGEKMVSHPGSGEPVPRIGKYPKPLKCSLM